jgi:hypothetical protein
MCGNALITFSGYLSQCRAELDHRVGAIWWTTPMIWEEWDRSARWSKVSLILDDSTLDRIRRVILPRIGIVRNVVHVVVSKDGVEQIGAFDNFRRECLVAGPQMAPILSDLVDTGVLASFRPIEPQERFWHGLITNGAFVGEEPPRSLSLENSP